MAAHKWPLTEQLRLVDNVLTIDLLLACLVPLLDATREPAKNSLLPTLVTGFVQALAAVGGHPELYESKRTLVCNEKHNDNDRRISCLMLQR